MSKTFRLLAALAVLGAPLLAGEEPSAAPPAAVEPAAADRDAPMPEGWPAATRPGAIEVKLYPAYRGAIARSTDGTKPSGDQLFWPLFLHISRKKIAMTAPVIMTTESKPGGPAESSMEFLYRTPELGPVGPGGGTVSVEDRPAGTFVCIGIQGKFKEERLAEATGRLLAWLDEHRGEWVADGPPRRLGYHGPSIPEPRQLSEVQIPIKPAPTSGGPKPPA